LTATSIGGLDGDGDGDGGVDGDEHRRSASR
jgi:hypothetical protein